MDDEQDGIALVEARIERLAEAIDRCRKLALAAKIAIGAGVAWLALMLVGLVPTYPGAMFGALAAVIGGIVLAGSNSTTWAQNEASLRESEALRTEMIGRVEMRVIDSSSRWVH